NLAIFKESAFQLSVISYQLSVIRFEFSVHCVETRSILIVSSAARLSIAERQNSTKSLAR
ncbi:MAG: hypothetical protein PX639_02285, partial [Microcystis sp. M49637_WE12]|nr:hypothetical protein [Microcystis sp. M49637_WE12]